MFFISWYDSWRVHIEIPVSHWCHSCFFVTVFSGACLWIYMNVCHCINQQNTVKYSFLVYLKEKSYLSKLLMHIDIKTDHTSKFEIEDNWIETSQDTYKCKYNTLWLLICLEDVSLMYHSQHLVRPFVLCVSMCDWWPFIYRGAIYAHISWWWKLVGLLLIM